MARKHKHEEHANHEAWAIPYGDLVTLLLAFFVVMYSISSVNEGKYRVLSDSLSEAFGGSPKSVRPLQMGKVQQRGSNADRNTMIAHKLPRGMLASNLLRDLPNLPDVRSNVPTPAQMQNRAAKQMAEAHEHLTRIAARVEEALGDLIRQELVAVYRNELWLEVEIKADVLFDSASAEPKSEATDTIRKLGDILRDLDNGVRIEGYTDDRPISSLRFPSNWELSAARASSVLRILLDSGIDPSRLAVVGFGEQRPRADNATVEGRNANRRVVLVILASPQSDHLPDVAPPAMQAATPPAPAAQDTATVAAPVTSGSAG